ncbi:MAG: hypothetical protein NTY51_01150 [Deltaproteobacteria bacterium]|nr:hypothetical protein [Deltaproteobacteria bacterium]
MSRKSIFLLVVFILAMTAVLPGNSDALFVATSQNLRGALYQGIGPTPGHASEMAVVKCSQDSFAPRSCRVIAVRMECPPPVCAPPRKSIKKSSYSYAPKPTSSAMMNPIR